MNTPPSSSPNLPLPQWAYVPGEMEEDDADRETLWKAKSLVPSRFQDYVPARHPALRYGMTLSDRGYFRESQEVLEAVWAAAPQGGRERILLRACILVANGNLRLRMQKPNAAARLFGEALAELKTLSARKAAGRVTALPTVSRRQSLPRCCRRNRPGPSSTGASSPRPIRWLFPPSTEHEAKCMFFNFGLDMSENMNYCAYNH